MHTSQKLSKLFAENNCKLESDYFWVKTVVNGNENYDLQKNKRQNLEMLVKSNNNPELAVFKDFYPAYDLLWDICIKFPKEFFGEEEKPFSDEAEKIDFEMKTATMLSDWWCGINEEDFYRQMEPLRDEILNTHLSKTYLVYHTQKILELLQQNKIQEAEDYIWEHCLFNPKNK